MSVDTKCFVMANKESMMSFMPKIIDVLSEYHSKKKKEFMVNNNYEHFFQIPQEERVFWQSPEVKTYHFEHFSVYFGLGKNNVRNLSICHNCSCDYTDVCEGDKIIFSLGNWGESKEIMVLLIPVLKEYGKVFYDFNDCDDEGFIEM